MPISVWGGHCVPQLLPEQEEKEREEALPAWLRGSEVGTCPEQLLAELGLGDTSLPPAHGMQLGLVTPQGWQERS